MSRIGKLPIHVPAGVTVTIKDNVVTVKGPKGEMTQAVNPDINVTLEDGIIHLTRPTDEKNHRALHGLYRSLINNMVVGCSEGYKKELELLSGKKIDVAFVPLDPRQETDFDLGMRYFLEAAGASYVFPMHMWGDYTVVPLFKSTPTYREYTKQIQNISAPGQTFELDLSEEKQD